LTGDISGVLIIPKITEIFGPYIVNGCYVFDVKYGEYKKTLSNPGKTKEQVQEIIEDIKNAIREYYNKYSNFSEVL
jgi:hypothetical protein